MAGSQSNVGKTSSSTLSFEGKVAIVTGGGTGVGRATAQLLARRGCAVVINYSRSKDDAYESAKSVEEEGGKSLVVQANVADDADCRRLIQETVNRFGGIDILVNNAGTTRFIEHDNLEDVTRDDWKDIFSVNVVGLFQCVRAAQSHLAKRQGQIVNVASIAGLTGQGSSIPYCASKAAVINMTQSFARALAPDIRVNAVAPGFITGRWLEQGLGEHYEAVRKGWEARAPMHRVSDPIDVAEAIMGVIDGSRMTTGQTVVCDGGMLLGPLR